MISFRILSENTFTLFFITFDIIFFFILKAMESSPDFLLLSNPPEV